MPLFTKFFKLKSFTENRFGKYLLYALGEVILVVLGILIALQINNYNEESKKAKVLEGILKNVSYDLITDTIVMSQAIAYYKIRQEASEKILAGTYGPEELSQCLLCKTMLSSYYPISINDKGNIQLKNFYEGQTERDTLVVDIVQFYNAFSNILDEIGGQVKDNSLENIAVWREREPWFSDMLRNKPSPAFLEYMQSQDYENRVAYFYLVACRNFIALMEQYKANAAEIIRLIKERYPELEPKTKASQTPEDSSEAG